MAYQIGQPIIAIKNSEEYGLVWVDSWKRTHYYTKDGYYDGYSFDLELTEDDIDELLIEEYSFNDKNFLA